MISHEHRCVFIHIPKTGGTSIGQVLGFFEEVSWGAQDHGTIRDVEPLPVSRNLRMMAFGSTDSSRRWAVKEFLGKNPRRFPRLSQAQFDSYYKFAVVRSPWARAHSWYRNVMRDSRHGYTQMSFREFLGKHLDSFALQPQLFWLRCFDGQIRMDRIVKFEHLERDMPATFAAIGLGDTHLPHLLNDSVSPHSYVDAYDAHTKQIISERYAEEIELFGFHFDDNQT